MTGETELNKRIGQAIRSARLARGVTQDDLAVLLDVDRTLISRYERGSRTMPAPALVQVFAYLEYSLSALDPQQIDAADGGPGEQPSSGVEAAVLPQAVRRIMAMLLERPDLVPTVEDVLQTFVEEDDLRHGAVAVGR
jgi:transcriptional regulator with XRE-family HTH domain